MEVDRIFYIFGSFARKKHDKRKKLEQSISAGNSPLCGSKDQRFSPNLSIPPRTSAYEDKQVTKDWECGLCHKELVEPRLLACLHSFCTLCLRDLHQQVEGETWSEFDEESVQIDHADVRTASGRVSAGSGYESDLRRSGSEDTIDHRPRKWGIFTRKISGKCVLVVVCPICGCETPLPLGGIAALPLNYIMLRKMSSEQDSRASVLCDLCDTDNKAESRCGFCVVRLCASCGEAHGRQCAQHALRPLRDVAVHCARHPAQTLSVYCVTCQQLICVQCSSAGHGAHVCVCAGRAARGAGGALRAAAHGLPRALHAAANALHSQAQRADSQAAQLENEIATWANEYRSAVETHTSRLRSTVSAARTAARAAATRRERGLQRRAAHAQHALRVAGEVLSEAREDELLTLSNTVLQRLESLSEIPMISGGDFPLRFSALASAPGNPSLIGALYTTHTDPERTHTQGTYSRVGPRLLQQTQNNAQMYQFSL